MTSKNTNKKLILVCDDDPDILDIITNALLSTGQYEVVGFGTAAGVEKYLENERSLPALLILDLWLPDKDSDELIPILREEDAPTKKIPILLISAILSLDFLASELGVEAHLSKPFLIDELLYLVDTLLKEEVENNLPQPM